jgi:carbonic anhydrase
MRPRFRLSCRTASPVRAIALAAAALCGLPSVTAAGDRPLVVADITPIPTSPSFRMGMRRADSGAPTLTRKGELPTEHGNGVAVGGEGGDATLVGGSGDRAHDGAKSAHAAASAPAGAASAGSASASASAAASATTARTGAGRATPAAPARAADARATPGHAGAATTAAAGASAPAAAMSPIEVLDHLRERLAEKLGATAAGNDSRYVMRVSNRGESGENIVSAVHGSAAGATRRRGGAARAAGAASAAGADDAGLGLLLHPTPWDYTGAAGPEAWGRLPGFEKCATGTRQSPIDIRDGIAVDLEPIRFEYRPGAFAVIDTGHTVQVNVAPGNAITVMGRRYELAEFHFHRPAEERVDGRGFDMVVHLVHKDAAGHVAVVAVLLERGNALPAVQAVWNNLPLEKGEELKADVPLDPADLLPADRRYYTYMGSLTTPPCTEGVLWMVLKQPVQISPEQDAIFAHLYPMNARPVQQADGRLIKASD